MNLPTPQPDDLSQKIGRAIAQGLPERGVTGNQLAKRSAAVDDEELAMVAFGRGEELTETRREAVHDAIAADPTLADALNDLVAARAVLPTESEPRPNPAAHANKNPNANHYRAGGIGGWRVGPVASAAWALAACLTLALLLWPALGPTSSGNSERHQPEQRDPPLRDADTAYSVNEALELPLIDTPNAGPETPNAGPTVNLPSGPVGQTPHAVRWPLTVAASLSLLLTAWLAWRWARTL